MASVIPSMAIVAVDKNGLPPEFSSSSSQMTRRMKSRQSHSNGRRRPSAPAPRRRTSTPTTSTRRNGRPSLAMYGHPVTQNQPRARDVFVAAAEEKDDKEERNATAEEERASPPTGEASPEQLVKVKYAPKQQQQQQFRGFLSFGRSKNTSQSKRKVKTCNVKTIGGKKEEDVLEELSTSVKIGGESSTVSQSSGSTKQHSQQPQENASIHEPTRNQSNTSSTRQPSEEYTHSTDGKNIFGDKEKEHSPVLYLLSGKSNVKKIREIPILTTNNSLTGSISNRSLGTYTKPKPRRLIQPPNLDDLFDDDSSVDDSVAGNRGDNGEIEWIAGAHRDDRTTSGISTVNGNGSFLGVDSVIGDPTAICGLLIDVVYRDITTSMRQCGESIGIVREQRTYAKDDFYTDDIDTESNH
uniref:Uncharacterized protein n=1 Tax=Amphora coffeiformis TaxID=265554 RepID=A0A7S3P719_9STRA|mmetsp:Transcript_18147/g.34433  ORF Transcript_18147/g.34433 Transcript_18147/m.34433 type:complete len:411 (+) Transcript_18147:98-1330(+)|eukprot:scaffold8005_cov275-Amphora_coffeaeformis.AAC.26